MTKRRAVLSFAVCALCMAVGTVAEGQEPRKTARVGWLGWVGAAGGTSAHVPLAALKVGLSALGWHEGRNLVIEVRTGDRDRARDLTAELLQQKVDVIVAQGPMVFGARAVAGTIPLVFGINGDPVEAGLVASLARPGANVTGTTALTQDLAGKRLELLKELLPRITRIAVIANQAHPGVTSELRETEAAAARLGMTLQFVPVRSAADFEGAFDAISRSGAEAIVAFPDTLINQQARPIAEFAARKRIPAVSGWAEFTEAGNLLSYGPNLEMFYQHIALYVDKLLRGAAPQSLPVEQPTRFELTLNLKAATAIGLTVPPAFLVRAGQVLR